jgi:hypothetical protein
MKRTQHVGLLVVSLVALVSWPVLAQAGSGGSVIAKSLGNVRWGMSPLELKTALKGKLKDKGQQRALESSYVEFNGSRTRWDSSPVAEEYTHGNDEAMLNFTESDGSENYYFFIGGQLWKWVKLYPTSSFGGRDYKGFAKKVKARFGTGYDKQGEVNSGTGFSYKFVEFLDRETRLRAVDKSESQNQFALVFESMGTVRSLSALRSNTTRRATNKRAAAVAKSDARDRADEPSASRSKGKSGGSAQPSTFTLASNKQRSLFGDDNQGESASDYQARKQRVVEQERSKQRRQHERTEEQKKGKILDELAGVDDDDPLSGMK